MAIKITLVHVVALSTVVTVGFLLMYWKMRSLERQVALAQSSATKALALAQESQSSAKSASVPASAAPHAAVPAAPPSGEPSNLSREAEKDREITDSCDAESVSSENVEEVMRLLRDAEHASRTPESVDGFCLHFGDKSPVFNAEADGEAEAETEKKAEDVVRDSVPALSPSPVPESESHESDDSELPPITEEELRKKNLDELKNLLKNLNLSTKGNKGDLIQRLLAFSESK